MASSEIASGKDSTADAEDMQRRVFAREKSIRKLYRPLEDWLGEHKHYFTHEFPEELSPRLVEVPEASLVCPPVGIVVPLIRRLSYSRAELSLKNMYLSLMATATDGRDAQGVHPSFVEAVARLSAKEARLLPMVLGQLQMPIAEVAWKSDDGQSTVLGRHLLDVNDRGTGQPSVDVDFSLWVDNWIQLGLVEVDYSVEWTGETSYQWVQRRPEFLAWKAQFESSISFDKGVLRVTDFGKSFARAIGPRDSLVVLA
ncbi:MAG: DUF4393 domain-containing protein [Actinomycetota bacterium]|nr:DUF4393 domain-containing protein [Actinomycetota bacterium]MDP2288932.1 DUF4393 domain-containing protein [Actinomycetota bacterium]